MRALSLQLAAALLIGTSSTAAAADLLDPATGTRFEAEPTVDGTDFRCLGAGVPVSHGYAVTFCVEAEQAEAIDALVKLVYPDSAGASLERMLAKDQDFFDALTEVPGDKLVVLHLVSDTSRGSLSEAFRSALSSQLEKGKLDRLVGLVAEGGARGESALIYSHGAQVTVDVGGVSHSLEDDEIAQKLWQTWLGPKSISPTLKASIAHTAACRGIPSSA